MLALIDGDLVSYINAASAENDGADIAKLRADNFIRAILEATEADEYRVFISGGQNFRYEVNPYYKANRTQPKPIYLQDVNEFLVTEWKAEVTDGIEADDALGISQCLQNKIINTEFIGEICPLERPIICSIDKDMDQIPGLHYSWPIIRKGEVVREGRIYEVSEDKGIRTFWKQMIVGDVADNVIGISGIGDKKSDRFMENIPTNSLFSEIRTLYNDDDRFFMNADLLWIMREERIKFTDQLWVQQKIIQDKNLENC